MIHLNIELNNLHLNIKKSKEFASEYYLSLYHWLILSPYVCFGRIFRLRVVLCVFYCQTGALIGDMDNPANQNLHPENDEEIARQLQVRMSYMNLNGADVTQQFKYA